MATKKFYIVIDAQNDFVTGPLGTPEAQKAIKEIAKILKERENKDYLDAGTLIFTRDTHLYSYLDTTEGKFLPIKHCITGTPGWCIVNELQEYAQKTCIYNIINKDNFGFSNWKTFFNENFPYDSLDITLMGLCTDICVIVNALMLRTLFPNAKISVLSSCCAGTTPENHEAALKVMKACNIEII